MTTYGGFNIEHTPSGWIAVRTTKKAIHRLSPKRSFMEARAAIDMYLADLSVEELFAL